MKTKLHGVRREMNVRKSMFAFASCVRLAMTLLLMLSIASSVTAQITVTQDQLPEFGGDVETVEIVVSPAAQPDPIFKHRLTWLPDETTAGNAASVYLHSLGENMLAGKWKKAERLFGDEVYQWSSYDTPRDEIPIEKLKEASAIFDEYIQHHIDRATRRRDCDWGFGIEDLTGEIAIGLQLNGLQETRSISRAIALQTKLAILESRFDDAIDLMRMNYRLGENVGSVKMLVGYLVGVAEVGITNRTMLDFIATPDSPNMFWALSELQRPIIDLREAFRLECRVALRIFPEIVTAETAKHSAEEWSRIVRDLPEASMSTMSMEKPNGIQFIPAVLGVMSYGPAKQRLIESGMAPDVVEQMAVGQVLLIDAHREYRRLADYMEKEVYLPFPQSVQRSGMVEDFLKKGEVEALDSIGKMLAYMLLPAVQQVRNAQIRIEREIDCLRVIEALRMHAAVTGEFPKSLDEVDVVLVPNNPATGKPFLYRLDGEVAVIDLPRSDGVISSKRFKVKLR